MLKIKNLNIGFNDILVVEDVNLSINQADKMAIIGETGSGKSMLVLAIMKLLSEDAQIDGSIKYRSKELLDMSDKELEKIRSEEIGYIGQGSGNGLNPLLNIGYQVSEVNIESKRSSIKEGMKEAVKLLKRFNLSNEEEIVLSYPHTLSGGMKQRVMVATGIAANPDLILADEPTKGLDSKRIDLVVDSFNKLEKETIICVTHDIRFAQAISNKICLMYAGEQMEISNSDDFFEEPLHPYAKAMLAALPENGLQLMGGFAPARSEKLVLGCKFADRCSYRSSRCEEKPPLFELDKRKVRCWLYATKG